MSMPSAVHDSRRFPIVHFDASRMYPGYADAWCSEMDQFAAVGQPFVLIYTAGGPEESQADRVQRGVWLKHHKDVLAGKLLALIHVEPDTLRLTQLQSILPKLVHAFGTPQAALASMQEAEALARQVLASGALVDAQ